MPWTGECNQCGRCCEAVALIGTAMTRFRCVYLLLSDKLGRPGATICALHKTKKDGMPILMVSEDQTLSYKSHCVASYPREKDAVPPECSMVWIGELTGKPRWKPTYAPGV